MPRDVDEKVVSMQFDNKQFEKGIAETSKSIDDFKKKLDFSKLTGSLKTFSSGLASVGKGGLNVLTKGAKSSVSALNKLKNALSVTKAAKNLKQLGEISLSGLQTSVTSLGERLESLGSLSEMAMYRVKNAILDAAQSAISFGKSLSFDQIGAGLSKYEQKISSIKTISNATGLGADAVDSQLQRLNWFTDETSASFSEMVNNIGKFTSVGKGLDESITAMQGIATWGYHSGANVAEINRAMYNLSQALGTGAVKLMDWKSIENAGMATKEFKEQAIAAAEAAGTLVRKNGKLFTKKGNKEITTANFNETLAQGWFTSDVLMSTLDEYGSFATKLRKYQQEHPLYSTASEAMEAMDNERIERQEAIYGKYLNDWTNKSGKSSDQIKKNIAEINKIANVKEREKEIKKFAETTGMSVAEATKVLDELAETEESLGEKAFKSSQEAKSFTDAVEATKDAVSTQWMNSFQTIFGGLEDSVALWTDVTDILWDLFASGGDSRNNMLKHWAEDFGGREDLFGEDGVMHSIADAIFAIKDALSGSFTDVFFPGLSDAMESFVSTADRANMAASGILTDDQITWAKQGNYYGSQLKKITDGIKQYANSIRDFFQDESNAENMGKVFRGLFSIFKGIGQGIGSFVGGINDFLKQSGALERILEIFGAIGDKFSDFFTSLTDNGVFRNFREEITETLMGFDGILDNINLDFVTSSLNAIFAIFKGGWKFVKAVLDGVTRFTKGSGGMNKTLGGIQEFADSITAFFDRIEASGVFTEISDFVYDILKNIGSLADDIDLSFISHVLDAIFATVRGIAGFIGPVINGFVKGIKNSGALKTISKTITTISDSVTRFFNTIRNNGDYDRIEKSITEIVEKIGSLFDGLDWSGLDTFLTGAWAVIKNAWMYIKTVLGAMIDVLNAFGIPQAVINAFGEIGRLFTWLSDKMEEFHVWEDLSAHLKSGIGQLKEVFDHFKSEIGRFLEDSGIAAKFREWKEKLKNWLFPDMDDGELTGSAKFFASVRESYRKLMDTLKNADIYGWLMDKWNWLKDSGIIDGIKDFWNTIKGLFAGEDISEVTANAKDGIKSITAQGGFFDKVKDIFSNLDWNSLAGLAIGIVGLVLAFKVVGAVTGLIKKVTGVVEGVGEFVEGLADITGGFADKLKENTKMTQIAILITAISGAIYVVVDAISKLGQLSTEELIRGAAGVTFAAGIIVAILFLAKTIQKSNATTIKIRDLIGLVVIVLMLNKLTDMIMKFAGLSLEQAAIGVVSLTVTMGLILAFMKVLASFKGQTLTSVGFLYTVGDVLVKMSNVVAKLGTMKVEELVIGISAMAVLLVAVALFIKATTGSMNALNAGGSVNKVRMAANVAYLTIIGTMIEKIANVVMRLSAMSWDEIGRGLTAMAGILLMLALFLNSTTKVINKDYYKTSNTAGFFKIIGIALAMVVLGLVLKMLAKMSWEEIGRGLTAMAGIMVIMTVFMKTTTKTLSIGNFSKNQAGIFKMLGFAVVMLILSTVLKKLAKMEWEEIGKGLAAMAGMMLILAVFIKSTTKTLRLTERSKSSTGFFKILAIGLAVVLIAHAFKGLADLSWEGIAKGVTSLTAILGLIAIFMKTANLSIGEGGRFAITAGVMIGIGIAVTLFAVSLKSLSGLPIEGILKGIIGLTGILTAMALFMRMTAGLAKGAGFLKGLGALLPMAFAMGVFVAALMVIKDIDPAIVVGFGTTLAVMMGAMAVMMGVIAIGGAIPMSVLLKGALAISLAMTIIIGIATALVAGIGALANSLPGFKAAIESGVVIFELVGKAFGSLIGGFIGGILSGIAHAGPDFADGIVALGKGVKAFAESIDGITNVSAADREAAFMSLLALVGIAHLLPRKGGVLQILIGQGDMSGFATDIANLGVGIKSFADSIDGISKISNKDRDSALSSILALVGIAWLLPRKGGLIQKIFGQGDMSEFAKDIGNLGVGLKSFASSIKGLSKNTDENDMKAAMTTAYDLAEFAKFVTDPGSIGDILRNALAKFLGVNTSFADFIMQIGPFGEALGAYSKAVSGIEKTSGSSDAAVDIANDILELKNKVEDPGTVAQVMLNWFAKITGTKNNFSDFIAQIGPFGEALKAYANAVSGFSTETTTNDTKAAIAAATSIQQFADKFGSDSFSDAIIGAIDTMFGNDTITQFTKFISQIEPFGLAIKAYANAVSGFTVSVSETDTKAAMDTATSIQKFADKFGSDSFSDAIIKAIDTMFGNDALTQFEKFIGQIEPFGKAMKAYANAISGFTTSVDQADTNTAIEVATSIQEFANKFGSDSFSDAIIGAIDSMFGNNAIAQFTKFIGQIVPFGEAMKAYANAISGFQTGVNPSDTSYAIATATSIQEFAKKFGSDSFGDSIIKAIDSMFGNDTITQFTKFIDQIVPFGKAIKAYAEGITGISNISDQDTQSALSAAKGIKDFAESFKETGLGETIKTVISLFTGNQENDMLEFATFSEGFINLGTGLKNYAEGIAGISEVTPEQMSAASGAIEGVKTLAESLVKDDEDKTWIDHLEDINNSIFGTSGESAGGQLSKFGSGMLELGKGVAEFANAAGQVQPGNTTVAMEAVTAVAELANSDLLKQTEVSSGLWGDIDDFLNGSKVESLSKFSGHMKGFGEAISAYAEAIKEYPKEKIDPKRPVQAVKDYIAAIAVLITDDEIVDAMGFNGKFIDAVEGIVNSDEAQRRYDALNDFLDDMGTFGEQIQTFTNAINDYKSPDTSAWENFKTTIGEIGGLAAQLMTEGYYGNMTVVTDLIKDLEYSVPGFVRAVKLLSEGGIDYQNGEEVDVEALKTLTDGQIQTINVIGNFLAKSVNLASLSSNVHKYAEAWTEITDAINTLTYGWTEDTQGKLSSISFVLYTMVDVMNQLAPASDALIKNGWSSESADKYSLLAGLGKQMHTFFDERADKYYLLAGLGKQMHTFFDEIGNIRWSYIDYDKFYNTSMAISVLANALSRLHEAQVTTEDLGLIQALNSMLYDSLGEDEGHVAQTETIAKNFIGDFCLYVGKEVTAATNSSGAVYVSGYNMTIGFANGMKDNNALLTVAASAATVVAKAVQTMMAKSQEHSPSKVTEQIGRYMSEGLAIGLGKEDTSIEKNASSAAGLALSAFWSALLNSEDKDQPVITPVVDLSNVQAGAEEAGYLFGGRRYGLNADMSLNLAGRAGRNDIIDDRSTTVNVDTTNIANTIDAINVRLDSLVNRVSNLKVVMNNGALVGQIAPQMNRELGRLANRSAMSY